MKQNIIIGLMAVIALVSCDDYETYADQKEKERDAISQFMIDRHINEISEEVFHANGNRTNVDRNEFVYMSNSGVYMQITRKGAGKPLQDNVNTELYVRFTEVSIFDTTAVITNNYSPYDADIMSVVKTGTTYTASFTYGGMYSTYGASVPAGWLVPLKYINVDGPTADEDISFVKLIVPHTQGHSVASSNVYPYYYEIKFQRQPGL